MEKMIIRIMEIKMMEIRTRVIKILGKLITVRVLRPAIHQTSVFGAESLYFYSLICCSNSKKTKKKIEINDEFSLKIMEEKKNRLKHRTNNFFNLNFFLPFHSNFRRALSLLVYFSGR